MEPEPWLQARLHRMLARRDSLTAIAYEAYANLTRRYQSGESLPCTGNAGLENLMC